MAQITRTYPQPDAKNLSPRDRALAVFKYLGNVEPEQAVLHPLFQSIEHAFIQTFRSGAEEMYAWVEAFKAKAPGPDGDTVEEPHSPEQNDPLTEQCPPGTFEVPDPVAVNTEVEEVEDPAETEVTE